MSIKLKCQNDRKFYGSIFGITRHPEKSKHFVLKLNLGCLMHKSVWHYLEPLKMALGQKVE